jgi:uncharacterized protein with ParB-like and HNH nuclease domain
MNAKERTMLKLFEDKIRFEVPLYQRQYNWTEEKQWDPLWGDIQTKFKEKSNPEIRITKVPPHFLGAIVLYQEQTSTTDVDRRTIIDGQQRLMTIQLFLAAYRDFCLDNGVGEVATECDRYITNPEQVDNNEEGYKIWPTQPDREVFVNIMAVRSKKNLEGDFPLIRGKPELRPLMAAAYIYFYKKISEFFLGKKGEKPLKSDVPLSKRLNSCLIVLKQALLVVVIDLDKNDDPQVIFETLNARGEPLLPIDLVRNYVFLRAEQNNESSDKLYETYWKKFDDQFWRKHVTQARSYRPGSDLFLQHFLVSQLVDDVRIKRLYVTYKTWIDKYKPYDTVGKELEVLSSQGDFFKDLILPPDDFYLNSLADLLSSFDTSTIYPLLLYLNANNYADEEWQKTSHVLESYVVRRAICGYSTKNYNKNFLSLIKHLKDVREEKGIEASTGLIINYLSGLSGPTGSWPDDEKFKEAWLNQQIYHNLDNRKIVYILKRLNTSLTSSKSETFVIKDQLTVEHILPQSWIDKWSLQDGSKGMDQKELEKSDESDLRAIATRKRDEKIHTIGNLTLLTKPLNTTVLNNEWSIKKQKLYEFSFLALNKQLCLYDSWDETQIENRAVELFEKAKTIWPEPTKIKGD